ncbi:MAG: 3-deoxy-D-manno-octulosonate 8-phosphate phosphatase [Bacteroidetes bacterium]|jgi:3-deoxy-D-manno-octulosonate 8-phosphate phosphatase (KDO 8-P phosphatase)|nr:MAG: 3-deoxy-D-manno-octulosonate 8-phosphate phosphatase [Bacteroidota bacterium]REK52557.1 MAG: 3-deoxy-D-manno-octulosonate 8-phosphate phosphatase [Bacteroidota bacterium]
MNYKEIFKNITTVVLDVDGVLTNGDIILMPGMQPVRKMNAKDGYAMQLAVRNGIRMAIITGGRSPEVKERLQGLGITDIYLGASSKMESYEDLKMCYDLTDDEILYMGDDLPDYDIMKIVALAAAPQDAAPEIKSVADYVSPIDGGKGCVRDVLEQLLKIQGKWARSEDRTW